jgi:hypothetical protein
METKMANVLILRDKGWMLTLDSRKELGEHIAYISIGNPQGFAKGFYLTADQANQLSDNLKELAKKLRKQ